MTRSICQDCFSSPAKTILTIDTYYMLIPRAGHDSVHVASSIALDSVSARQLPTQENISVGNILLSTFCASSVQD
jgi:hypothetical protein